MNAQEKINEIIGWLTDYIYITDLSFFVSVTDLCATLTRWLSVI